MELISAKEQIQQIRSEFQIGADKTRVLDSLNKSISHLAESLYHKNTHFILELIQNAEDNQYPPNVDPDLIFYFIDQDPSDTPGADGALLVVNNEIGFQSENVSAICAAGDSTKKDKRKGYIGEKGIGFKSVFTVSSQPFIFSGKYQFKFQDVPDAELGFRYIVPTWVENSFEIIKQNIGKTCILLPLKSSEKNLVKEQLQQIAPETILFLKKLKGLQIKINDEGAAEVIRSDQKKPLIEVVTNKGEAKYWLIEKEYEVPVEVKEEKREGIDSRLVSIAFPLLSSFLTNETIYAFLPTNVQSGFKFLVNADFILSTNRGDIREDLPWNLWLSNCIAPTFIETFVNLLKTKKYRFLPYRYIPLIETPCDIFLQPVVEQIISGLKSLNIVWTLDGKSLAEPGRTRFAPNDFRQLIDTKQLPNQLTSTPLIHPDLEKEEYKQPLEAIGVKSLSADEIINCLKDDSWIDDQKTDWFFNLYIFLSKQEWADFDRLNKLNLVPTEDGEKICGQTNWVYFPSDKSLKITQDYPDIFHFLNLKYIDRKLNKRISSQTSLLDWVKTSLGVEELNLSNICKQLLDKLSKDVNNIDAPNLIRITRFIRDHYEEFEDHAKEQVKSRLPLLLADGSINTKHLWSDSQPLVVPSSINPVTGWQLLFPDPEDYAHMIILSDQYLENESIENRIVWLKFFIELGATQYPQPQKLVVQFYPCDIPLEIMDHIKLWVSAQGWRYFTLIDWKAPKWLKQKYLHPSEDVDNKRSNALLTWLDHHHNSGNEKAEDRVRLEYSTKKQNWYMPDPCLSEFAYCVRNTSWFPSTKGPEIPGRVFLDKPDIREFFKNLFPYTKLLLGEGVIKYLGIKTSATVEEIIALLRELAWQSDQATDPKLVSRIYSFLSERWNKSIRDEFEKNAWILSTKPKFEWIHLKEAIWFDLPMGFDDIAYVDISSQYNEKLYTFFVKQLGVSDKLDDKSYAQAFINLGRVTLPDADLIEPALEKIFPVLLKVAKSQNEPDWWKSFLSDVKVWTQSDQFCPPSDVFIPDDGELTKKMEKEGIHFAWRPNKDTFADYLSLYQCLGVRSLIDNVAISPEIKKEFVEQQGSVHLTNYAKKAICYYLRNSAGNDSRKLYETLKTDGKIDSLLKTNEEQVSLLHTIFQLNGTTAREVDAATFWDRDKSKLYISVHHSQDELETEIPSAIARRLVITQLAKDLENFIGRILGCSPEKAERIISKHNWNMPEDELGWIESVLENSEEISGGDKPDGGNRPAGGDKPDGGNRPAGGDKPGGGSKPAGGNRPAGGNKPAGGNRPDDGVKPGGGEGTWHPRMVSYVEKSGGGEDRGNGPGTSGRERQIGDAGINKVLKYEESQGRIHANYLGQTHEGWDINSEEVTSEGVNAILGIRTIRRIEVKSKLGEWDGWGIGLTAAEYKKALEFGKDYYLYVVENALDPNDNRPPFIFRDPAEMITDYRLDDNWKKLTIIESEEQDKE